ncbi:hypothetical protein CDT97_21635 [Cronobacter sakazakii]|nr:hypothetical protein CDT97_21635 [Cronobacter sakazakii]
MTGISYQASEGGIKSCRKKPGGVAADSDRERSERGSAGEIRLNEREGRTALRMMILAEMPSYAV